MKYRVVLPKQAQKQLDRLSDSDSLRILERLSDLEASPRSGDVKKLRGRAAWRLRVGDYRVIYEIHDRELRIVVITIGHRRDVYR